MEEGGEPWPNIKVLVGGIDSYISFWAFKDLQNVGSIMYRAAF